jgi:STE24 endopeptidase
MSDIEITGDVPGAPSRAEIDPARQEQARVLARKRRWLGLFDTALSGVLVLVVIALGLAGRLRDALAGAGLARWQPFVGWSPWLVAAEVAVLLVAATFIGLPSSIYGFALARRFGLARQGYAGWAVDRIKGFVLGALFLVAAGEVLYLLLTVQPWTWWLWVAGGLILFNVLLANLAPVLLLPLFFKQTPLAEGDLRDRLMALAARARTRVRGVYVMNMSRRTSTANAAVMGLGNTRRIVLGDTILSNYSPQEIEVVMAHELGHQAHHDVSKIIAFDTVLNFAGFALIAIALRAIVGMPILGLHGINDIATLPVLALLLGIFSFISGPLSNTLSRILERQADRFALEMTHDPDAFVSAFRRLSNQNLDELEPHPLIELLFYDHPATGRRIRLAESWRAAAGQR